MPCSCCHYLALLPLQLLVLVLLVLVLVQLLVPVWAWLLVHLFQHLPRAAGLLLLDAHKLCCWPGRSAGSSSSSSSLSRRS
jgi:hypothetical protein